MIRESYLGSPMYFVAACGLLTVHAFAAGDRKRTPVWETVWAVCLFAAVMTLDFWLVDASNASTSLQSPMCILAILGFALWGLGMPKKEAGYCTVWAFLVTEITSQLFMPLRDAVLPSVNGAGWVCAHIALNLFMIGLAWFVCARFLAPVLQHQGRYLISRQKLILGVIIILFYLCVGNYQFIYWLLDYEPPSRSNLLTIYHLIAGVCCCCILYLQNSMEKRQQAEQELGIIRQLWYHQQNQYRLSQENINLINRKCHDLKHQMEALRRLKDEKELDWQLTEMEHSVLIYDSVVKTGNPVLDTVLTEKSLFCEEHQINMTCMADGTHLGFVNKVDLYTMFGNALDNAIESVSRQKETEKRVIQVSVFTEKDLLMIRVRNYCEEELIFENGLPVTTKRDKNEHGFGLKSIRYTAEKYGGSVNARRQDHAFVLQILLPLPVV